MARRSLSLALAGTLVAALALPLSAFAQETETDELPPYAAEELEAARSAQSSYDPVAQAREIPPPPNGISEPEEVPYSDRDRGDVEFGDFYTGLSDHGSWVETPEYGYVFIPDSQAQVKDWRPYTYGRWIWTRHGWTWVSEEPFGWATYHYGRWTMVPSYGWAWVPGYTWGPAWVAWRFGDSAIGWAPLYPGYVTWTTSYPVYENHWVFIGPTYFYSHPVHHHHYAWNRSHYYHGHTHWASHWHHGGGRTRGGAGYVYSGPPRSFVERRGRASVRETELRVADRPGPARLNAAGGKAPSRVTMYRPERVKSRAGNVDARNRDVRVPQNARVPQGVGSGLVSARQIDRNAAQRDAGGKRVQADRVGAPRAVGRDGGASRDVRVQQPRANVQAPRANDRIPDPVAPRASQAPRDLQPRDTTPRQVVPKATVPRQVAPKANAPRQLAPDSTAPRQVVPKATAPRQVAP